jgi:hypothetical protein
MQSKDITSLIISTAETVLKILQKYGVKECHQALKPSTN